MKKTEEKTQGRKRFPLEPKKNTKIDSARETKSKDRPMTKNLTKKETFRKKSSNRKDLSHEKMKAIKI